MIMVKNHRIYFGLMPKLDKKVYLETLTLSLELCPDMIGEDWEDFESEESIREVCLILNTIERIGGYLSNERCIDRLHVTLGIEFIYACLGFSDFGDLDACKQYIESLRWENAPEKPIFEPDEYGGYVVDLDEFNVARVTDAWFMRDLYTNFSMWFPEVGDSEW